MRSTPEIEPNIYYFHIFVVTQSAVQLTGTHLNYIVLVVIHIFYFFLCLLSSLIVL